ncbi:MAG TPA: hypothetical protein VE243_07400 [Candidatus Acidoferrum sp.]|nr:hypothetical protein [Candidatus Acidoferrum sp.]
MESTIKRLIAVAMLAAAVGLYGCSSSDPDSTVAVAATCEAQQDCEAVDNARQIRDEVDYQTEPALGYLNSPPGMLPIPLTSRNTSAN